ncbi:hypothetical protein F5X68DRAFT_192608 [Plectosphaerella plurivora]|uniref:Uncharacterized protein n=1 Tax=Plectosphaerella plurivora TaxID=936078 RepID=A0A9P9A9P8_9PEZI|nr:hypothetical protein F5X68DRAFT_192608 [Plectosphaerella plurivora]
MTQTTIGLSEAFANACPGLHEKWGAILVRTANAAENDEEQWTTALEKLRAYALSSLEETDLDPGDLALPEVTDPVALAGVGNGTLRTAFYKGIDLFLRRNRDPGDEEWPSDARKDAFIVVDGPSLASLVDGPAFDIARPPSLDEPWVVVVDSRDPTIVAYRGGGPYTGAVRVKARALGQFFDELANKSMERLCPIREYDGQIPLYDGSGQRRLIDPPGGLEGRYRFPQGTPRGAQGAKAMLDDIERAGMLWRDD